MSAFHDNALIGASGQQGYNISRSVRYRASASPYFTRPFATPTNSSKWTMSMWVKRGILSSATTPALFGKTISALANFYLAFDPGNTMTWTFSNTAYMTTTQVFRDPSAWYHIVAVWDSANATAAQRARLYVNGTEVTAFSVDNRSSITTSMDAWNTTSTLYMHGIGCASATVSTVTQFFDGYLTEVNFIDGQALTPSSFGENDTVTGVWKPKKYAGTYGNNGFYLNFSDNSAATAAAIGKDYSGNGNNWTPNNISVTSGVTYDSMLDVPTMWADGGNGRGNYCTLNPLQPASTTVVVPTDGNLKMTGTASGNNVTGTMAIQASTYFEGTVITGGGTLQFGVRNISTSNTYVYDSSGNKVLAGTSTAYGASFTTNDVIGVAVDPVNLTLQFFKNGTSQGTITSAFPSGDYVPFFYASNTNSSAANFGQRPFTYTPPSGFKALNTQNLPSPTISNGANYMTTLLWTSNASVKSVTGSAFQPDLVWVKDRQSVSANEGYHHLVDSVRGAGKVLSSNATLAEYWTGTNQSVTAFNSNGFTSGIYDGLNNDSMVSWLWKKSAASGFDIVTYTGTGANRTIAHSLGVAPKMVIVKARNLPNSIARPWAVWHTEMAATEVIFLDSTSAKSTGATTYWNSTLPTSSVFSVGTEPVVNGATGTVGEYVAYLFSEVAGFSKFGSYTGNGSTDGSFVYCGFRPAFVMVKRTDTTGNWCVFDNRRLGYNGASASKELYPNLSNAEGTSNGPDQLSNGFKLRDTYTDVNASGGTYIFAAFAENPFKNALAR